MHQAWQARSSPPQTPDSATPQTPQGLSSPSEEQEGQAEASQTITTKPGPSREQADKAEESPQSEAEQFSDELDENTQDGFQMDAPKLAPNQSAKFPEVLHQPDNILIFDEDAAIKAFLEMGSSDAELSIALMRLF